MTTETDTRKHLLGGFAWGVSGESIITMTGSRATGRHGTGAGAESLYLVHKQEAEEETVHLQWALKPQK
jgi:hypothetical protein